MYYYDKSQYVELNTYLHYIRKLQTICKYPIQLVFYQMGNVFPPYLAFIYILAGMAATWSAKNRKIMCKCLGIAAKTNFAISFCLKTLQLAFRTSVRKHFNKDLLYHSCIRNLLVLSVKTISAIFHKLHSFGDFTARYEQLERVRYLHSYRLSTQWSVEKYIF